MGIMHAEWTGRLRHWLKTLKEDFYQPLGELEWSIYQTKEQLSLEEAKEQSFVPVKPGYVWGEKYEYGWMKSRITLPEAAEGERIVLNLNPGGESTIFVNDQAFGTFRADWVREPHHYMVDNTLTRSGKAGAVYELMLETYAGHFFPESPLGGCATGPVLPGSYQDPKQDGSRAVLGSCSYGIWNEAAYQLYMDVDTLNKLLEVLDPNSLRAAKIAEALERFTLTVDFEQERALRIADYERAREELRPVMQAENGSTMPAFYAIGNAHLDLAWLWPMAETYRKTARTFAAQLRLIEEYPEYKFIQSQPASYEMCRQYYPELFERILKAAKTGQWIADGAMWVEPDTNMSSGEALIRQLLHGKRYYKEVFDVDSQVLWLPDTFGYTAALPQILQGCGVRYLVTQKIFWSYNEGEQFPYHYFTWEGMDGSKVVSFLPTSYTYYTSPTEANKIWNQRTQKRDLDAFLFPYGYGDGGGGPARDYVEYAERQKNLEGGVKMKMAGPQEFFEDMQAAGGPKNTYRGELYFSAHRGTYTAQAKVKENNRRAELAMRELEFWGAIAQEAVQVPYPLEQADALWKELLLHQFHDILPGSGIAEIYQEAEKRMGSMIEKAQQLTEGAVKALTAEPAEGMTVFNSLSFPRTAILELPESMSGGVQTADGEELPVGRKGGKAAVMVKLPPCGAVSLVPSNREAKQLMNQAVVTKTQSGYLMENGRLKALINERGEVISYRLAGTDREMAAEPMNRLRLYKDVPRLFDAWDIDSNYVLQELPGAEQIEVSVLQESGMEAVLEVRGRIGNSSYKQQIRLQAESDRLEFETEIDWKELHRLLKVAFPVQIYTDTVYNEMQFGYVERPVHRSRAYDKDRFEVCNHRYSALCDGSHGAAVLNDAKYGMSANENALELTLLTASASPEMRADNRMHHFTYAFTAWEGSFAQSPAVRQGYELNVKPLAAKGTARIAQTGSLFTVDQPNVILETVKPAEDGSKDLILRLYEAQKAAVSAKLSWALPGYEAYVCDMLENVQEKLEGEGSCELDFRAFEIKTLRLKKA
ncbi:MAG: alpha-mannosidase [Lachnospiraceae bacterium]|jgi:alpha-mannosidase|nr:alpha-mannosidase [Lachnospiraceae bacterium]